VRQADRPLAGVPVVVCRATADAGPLTERLRQLGARPVLVPLHRRSAPSDGGAALADALDRLEGYGWLVATSSNGVGAVVDALGRRDLPATTRVAAVGPATAAAFVAAGIHVDLVPSTATAADLAGAFPPAGGRVRVLAALAELASGDLAAGLAGKGYAVDRVDAYRMVEPSAEPGVESRVAGAGAVLFTSPSVVDRFVDRFSVAAVTGTAVCIGPRTAARARDRGLSAPVVARVHTDQGLLDALVAAVSPPGAAC
jgi:uroporphyrinogen-III synthase